LVSYLGLIVGAFAIPSDPNFGANGSHGSPGDGFLIMGCAALGFVVFVFVSIGLTWTVLESRKAPDGSPNNCPIDPYRFLV
jgi:hypothetical protein